MAAVLVSHENNKAVYTTEVAYEDFLKAVDTVYKRTRSQYRIPGFRKGHAPRKLIEAHYGKGVFFDDALNEVLPDAIDAAIEELGLEPIGRPDVDLKELEEGKPVVFEITTETMPHPELGDYTQIEVEKLPVEVSDEEIDNRIEVERAKNAVNVSVDDRPAENGDEVTIDFEGFIGDEAFEGGKGVGHKLVLGSNSFIPGFEDQVCGHSVGEEFDINVTFPEDYGSEDLAGKDARFHIVLHAISQKQLPELDDDFAQDVSEFDTFEEYRASVREELEKKKAEEVRAAQENQAIEKLIELSGVVAPKAMVEDQVGREITDMANRMQQMGLSLQQYMEYTGQTIDQLKEQSRPTAEMRVKGDLVLTSLIEKENIDYTEEELDAEIRRLGELYGAEDVEDFAKRVREAGNEKLVGSDLKKKKAIDRLMEVVRFVEPKAEEKAEEQSAE